MKTFVALSAVFILSSGLWAQNRSGFVNTGPVVRSFPSVIHPGGTSALPGVQRTTGSVLFPGGGTQIGVPGIRSNPGNVFNRGFNSGFNNGFKGNSGWNNGWRNGGNWGGGYAVPVAVPVPVYVGNGYDDPSAYAAQYGATPGAMPEQAPQAPPNVIVIYPQGSAPAPYGMQPPVQSQMVVPPQGDGTAPAADAGAEAASHYFIALKDHSIYSAVAYWVDGDTLHYFTTGSTHNEVSLSLVDRDLTKRLNDESGLQLNLPPAK